MKTRYNVARYNKALQRTGISVPLIENLQHDAVVSQPLKASVRRLAEDEWEKEESEMNNYSIRRWPLALVMSGTLIVALQAQNQDSAKDFEKKVSSNVPLFVDGERVYRGTEVTKRAHVTSKPEPMFTEKARKKKVEGTVMFRVVFEASGAVKVLNVLKRLPHGLTEQAQEAAGRIKFEPAMLDNIPVSQTILLQYNFNR